MFNIKKFSRYLFTPQFLLFIVLTVTSFTNVIAATFPNTSLTKGELLSHNAPEMGRLAIIEILGDYVVTIPEKPSSPAGSDFFVRAWDISDPRNPIEAYRFEQTEHPFLAHGTIKRNNELLIFGWPNNALRLNSDGSLSYTTWSGPDGHWNKSGMMRPWAAKHWWSYGDISGLAWLELDGVRTAEWDHLGTTGVIGFPVFMGNLMIYASDQSKTGVATYDVSDPANPRLLDVIKRPMIHPTIVDVDWQGIETPLEYGIGGYWSEIHGHYIVFTRRGDNPGIQVVDFSDPTNLRLHCDFLVKDPVFNINPAVSGDYGDPMYPGFQDEYVFAERYKLNVETCEVESLLDELTEKVETNQYSRPIGNLVLTGGMSNWRIDSNSAGLGIWAHQNAADTRPPEVAYHIPGINQTQYPLMAPISLMIPETLRSETITVGDTLTVRKIGGEEIAIDYVLSHTGLLTVDPLQYLEADTIYEVRLAGIQDAVGNTMQEYTFRFSTGANIDNGGGGSNSAPVINSLNATPSNVVLTDQDITISVNASDTDDDLLEYRFQIAGQGNFSAWTTTAATSFNFDTPGLYTINAEVRDASDIDASSIVVTVTSTDPEPNNAPVINGITLTPADNNITGEDILVSVNASDIDGHVLEYRFQVQGQGEYSAWGSSYSYTLNFLDAGQYTINVQVRDSLQSTNTSSINATVNLPPNSAPIINQITVSPANGVLIGQTVSLIISATDPDGDSLQYRYRVQGEGSYSDWSATASKNFVFPSAGLKSVNIQVRDQAEALTTAIRSFNILTEPASLVTTNNSSQLAYDSENEQLLAVNPDNDTLTRIDAISHDVIQETTTGNDPRSVTIGYDGSVWITAYGDDAVEVYNGNGDLLNRIETGYGSAPFAVVMSPDRKTAYVSLYGSGEVAKFDVENRVENGRLALGPTARALAISADGSRLLITRFISPQNWGEMWQVNTQNWNLIRTIRFDKHLENDTLANGRGTPNYLTSVVINANANRAYIVAKKDNVDRGLLNTNEGVDPDNTVRTLMMTVNLDSGQEIRSQRIDFDNADSPSSVVLSPGGNYLLVALQGRNQVFALYVDVETGRPGAIAAQFPTGLAPQGLVFNVDHNQLFVKNFTDRSVTSIDLTEFISNGIINPTSEVISTVSNETLSTSVLAGKKIFYNAAVGIEGSELTGRMSAEGYLSCASCHLDGGEDGRVWDRVSLGEGLRNNISLKGRSGTRFGNVHWSGNFDEIQDFEHDMRGPFGGRGFLSEDNFALVNTPTGSPKAGLNADLDNLAAYVESLGKEFLPRSPYRTITGAITTQGNRGKEVFSELNCQRCHRGKAFTDGVAHDVGTLRSYSGKRLGENLEGIKTPSLLGLFDTPPYLHDGSAKDIQSVFNTVGGDVYQAEKGSLSGPTASIVTTSGFSYLRDGSGILLQTEDSLSMTVDGGTGGSSIIRVRYGSTTLGTSLLLTVNDQTTVIELNVLPQVEGNDVAFQELSFETELSSGNNNIQIGFSATNTNQSVIIDDITISTASDLEKAEAHNVASGIATSEFNDLIAYLKQLDQNSAPEDHELIDLGESDNEVDEDEDEIDPIVTGSGSVGTWILFMLMMALIMRPEPIVQTVSNRAL